MKRRKLQVVAPTNETPSPRTRALGMALGGYFWEGEGYSTDALGVALSALHHIEGEVLAYANAVRHDSACNVEEQLVSLSFRIGGLRALVRELREQEERHA